MSDEFRMRKQLKFVPPMEKQSMGKNGLSRTIGIDLFLTKACGSLYITPINSKNSLTNCWVTIPDSDIPELVELLTIMYCKSRE